MSRQTILLGPMAWEGYTILEASHTFTSRSQEKCEANLFRAGVFATPSWFDAQRVYMHAIVHLPFRARQVFNPACYGGSESFWNSAITSLSTFTAHSASKRCSPPTRRTRSWRRS